MRKRAFALRHLLAELPHQRCSVRLTRSVTVEALPERDLFPLLARRPRPRPTPR